MKYSRGFHLTVSLSQELELHAMNLISVVPRRRHFGLRNRLAVESLFSAIVSEPRAVATGSCDTLENVLCSTQMRLDPVATARGSDTSRDR